MGSAGEPAHVGADLRQDDLSAQFTDPWDSAQLFDSVAKAGKPGIGLPVDLGNGGIERVDLLQMQSKQKTMVTFNASMQRFAQGCCRRTHLPVCKCSQFGRIGLAIDQRLNHCPAAAPHHVGKHRLEFDIGFLQRLLQALHMARLFAHQLLASAQQPP